MWGLSLYRGAASYNRRLVLCTLRRFQLLTSCGCGDKLLRHPLHKFFLFLLVSSYIKCRKSSFNISLATSCTPTSCRYPLARLSCSKLQRLRRIKSGKNNNNVFLRGTICLGNTYRRDKLPKQLAQALRTAHISIILSVKP